MDVRDNILNGAGEMFMRYGIKSITMDDISRSLGISKKTIYQYFEDKEALISSYVQVFLEKQKEDFLRIKSESKNVIDELMITSEYMRSNVCNINPSLLYDLRKYHAKAWKIFHDYKRNFIEDQIAETIREGVNTGFFRENIDGKILSRLRIEQVEMAFNTEIFPQQEFETANIQMQFFEHFIYGICTVKGHKLINKYKEITEEE